MSSALQGLSDTFRFHASPEAFLRSLGRRNPMQDGQLDVNHAPLLRARLLNRNVVIISSYQQVRHILCGPQENQEGRSRRPAPAYSAAEAYAMFMAPFFPSPNLLLSEDAAHAAMRSVWDKKMCRTPSSRIQVLVAELVEAHFHGLVGSGIDLYDSMKSLAWKILLGLFLGLRESDTQFAEIKSLQEDLLRGQFSLFPISMNVGFWSSPRNRGLKAKIRLQQLIIEQLALAPLRWSLFSAMDAPPASAIEEPCAVANHVLLFTSSLAAKALASLLTAFLLNVFAFTRDGVPIRHELVQMPMQDRKSRLRSMQLETERLSPPIVGIMRRAMQDDTIAGFSDPAQMELIPKGWDAWFYFVHAGRDTSIFGDDATQFVPERFDRPAAEQHETFAFSTGAKTCLGQGLMRGVCLVLAETMLDGNVRFDCTIENRGVRSWLGWDDDATAEEWVQDMQQLPVQHPNRPIMVKVARTSTTASFVQ